MWHAGHVPVWRQDRDRPGRRSRAIRVRPDLGPHLRRLFEARPLLHRIDRLEARPRSVMRILVIGAGGVGSAVVPIAARRDFFERMVVADYDAGRAERAVARVAGDPRFVAARVDASRADDSPRCAASTRSATSSTRSTRASSCRSSRAPSRPAPTTSTWRCRCRSPHPERPYELHRREARRRAVRAGATLGGGRAARARRHRRRAGPVRRLRPLRRRTTSSARSTRSASATAPTSSSTATTSRRRSRSGRRSRNASTRR